MLSLFATREVLTADTLAVITARNPGLEAFTIFFEASGPLAGATLCVSELVAIVIGLRKRGNVVVRALLIDFQVAHISNFIRTL